MEGKLLRENKYNLIYRIGQLLDVMAMVGKQYVSRLLEYLSTLLECLLVGLDLRECDDTITDTPLSLRSTP